MKLLAKLTLQNSLNPTRDIIIFFSSLTRVYYILKQLKGLRTIFINTDGYIDCAKFTFALPPLLNSIDKCHKRTE